MSTLTKNGRPVGRPPSCECGSCRKCKARVAARERYQRKTLEERRAVIAARDVETTRANDRARHRRDREKRLAAQRAYLATPEGRKASNEAKRRWLERNPEKRAAMVAVGNAIRGGLLTRPDACEHASDGCSGRIEAHHDDYARPLEVAWLCVAHHDLADADRRAREVVSG